MGLVKYIWVKLVCFSVDGLLKVSRICVGLICKGYWLGLVSSFMAKVSLKCHEYGWGWYV